MNTSFESIHAKIAMLEEELVRLHIAEEALIELDGELPRKRRAAAENITKTKGSESAAPDAERRQTIGTTITEVLKQHGALSAREITKQIEAIGRDINGRATSFTLQVMKKNGFVKNTGRLWQLTAKGAKQA